MTVTVHFQVLPNQQLDFKRRFIFLNRELDDLALHAFFRLWIRRSLFKRLWLLRFACESAGAHAGSGQKGNGKFRCVFHIHSFYVKQSMQD
ncbi:hypothetical protein D3C85_1225140 [compost metagenome]